MYQLRNERLRFIKANVDVAKINADLVEENTDLVDALYHSGYDPTDCIDCGGPPHNEWCRFWKLRHLFPVWFEEVSDE